MKPRSFPLDSHFECGLRFWFLERKKWGSGSKRQRFIGFNSIKLDFLFNNFPRRFTWRSSPTYVRPARPPLPLTRRSSCTSWPTAGSGATPATTVARPFSPGSIATSTRANTPGNGRTPATCAARPSRIPPPSPSTDDSMSRAALKPPSLAVTSAAKSLPNGAHSRPTPVSTTATRVRVDLMINYWGLLVTAFPMSLRWRVWSGLEKTERSEQLKSWGSTWALSGRRKIHGCVFS